MMIKVGSKMSKTEYDLKAMMLYVVNIKSEDYYTGLLYISFIRNFKSCTNYYFATHLITYAILSWLTYRALRRKEIPHFTFSESGCQLYSAGRLDMIMHLNQAPYATRA